MGVAEAGGGKPDALGRYIYLASLLWVLKMASNIVRCFKGSISRSKGRALWACFVVLGASILIQVAVRAMARSFKAVLASSWFLGSSEVDRESKST